MNSKLLRQLIHLLIGYEREYILLKISIALNCMSLLRFVIKFTNYKQQQTIASLMSNQYIIENKENIPNVQRRLSLKYSSTAASKNMPRMSIPAKRESISNASVVSAFFQTPAPIQRQSRQSLVSCGSIMITKPPKKQAILTNLMRKLDNQQQLKQIIQSKIKKSKKRDSLNFYEVHSEVYLNNEHSEAKVRNYQEEVDYYKKIIVKLMEKIANLEEKVLGKQYNQTVDLGIQTQHQGCQTQPSTDFIENLEKTLSILSGKKGK